MDPNQTLIDALNALAKINEVGDNPDDREGAIYALAELKHWLDNGGFVPYVALEDSRGLYAVGKPEE